MQTINQKNLLIIDSTQKNQKELKVSINSRTLNESFNESDFIKVNQIFKLNHNMEQKDLTQIPQQTGLIVWKAKNKLI